jgi:hypothetical protein
MLASATAAELENFITRQGDQLLDGERPYRFISFNIPNLLVIEDAFEFTRPNPWRSPDEYEIEDALESVRQTGGQAVRTYVISVFREGSDMGQTVHVLAPGKFNEEAFQTLDRILAVANRKGIRLIIPLVDNWKWMGGVPQYAAFRGKEPAAFWSDPELIADFKKTIEHVVNRTNSITGIPYKKDKAILGWETGNEIDATAEWTHEIAAYIKQLDPNHLVIDGRTLHGVEPWQIDEPATDVLSTHHYPHGLNPDFVTPIRKARAATKGKKPYFVGEFGFVDTPHLARVYDATIQDGIAGALIWSLRFRSRDGGFYWHMEVGTGGNFYKSYHWPGFASGAAYDEKAVLELTRNKGFEIQGLEPPAIEPPAAPKLLSIGDPAAISWQGATGAAAYDVERATSPTGPWTKVGRDVSDADVQYRPPFHDENVTPGEAYFYRVIARNSAGDSVPSNVVGPVTPAHRTLVDDCGALGGRPIAGIVRIATDNVRTVQEDAHRIVLKPGAAIEYRVGAPILGWRVDAFANSPDVKLIINGSADNEHFTQLAVKRRSFSSGKGDYGYLVPIRLEGKVTDRDVNTLQIVLPGGLVKEGTEVQIARVEIQYDE